MILDPLYFILLGPAMLLALWAQWRVKSAYHKGSRVASRSRMTGAQAANFILDRAGIREVRVEMVQGFLSDHYDPRHKVLRLSPEVYGGHSLAALGIAAHEAGHAIQDKVRYAPLTLRNAIVPLASVGSNMAFFIFIIGMFMQATGLMWAGIILFSAVVAFQLINLPVEFNASSRAKSILLDTGIIAGDEAPVVKQVLNAAAMTYVAATLTAVLTLVYFILRAQQSRN